MKKLLLTPFLVFFATIAFAQNCLVNADIIYMHTNAVSDRVILTKINKSVCCFRMEPGDIVELTNQGVPERIVNRMIYVMQRRNVQPVYYTPVVYTRPRVQIRYRAPRIGIMGNF
ncbi:hypothetical protein [Dyadobacter alkalitolerans]|uniref:hypothetical protein n=1 Tax=Dyadobacter alkalitolerans TaxID=492736 RepID=UPI00047B908A|nr:hypothetical protein [Dyadobacter alkalitolerans]